MDGGSGSTTVVDTSAPTTGPDGPYVYKEEVVELEPPPPRACSRSRRCRAVGRW
ncbi:hypothetical protein [Nannocystis pusilla]|uniref:hypothetical protein n=1 Tax=Nannocystis pusilla TaxID=889268 RepID=UPI003B77E467